MARMSNAMTMKRINREIRDLVKEDMGDMTLEPSEGNLFLWKASIPGPEGSPYEGGVFNLNVELPSDYPFSAPKVAFSTRIYHMNVSERGNICIDILKQNWSPALSLYKVVLSLSSLLTDPNPKDPLVPNIASEYIRNRQKHDSTAREWTSLYAQKPKVTSNASTQTKGKNKAAPPLVMPVGNEESGRPRRAGRPPQAPRAAANVSVIDISDSEDTPTTARSPGRTSASRTRSGSKRKRGTEDAGEDEAAGSRRRRGRAGEVIVIED